MTPKRKSVASVPKRGGCQKKGRLSFFFNKHCYIFIQLEVHKYLPSKFIEIKIDQLYRGITHSRSLLSCWFSLYCMLGFCLPIWSQGKSSIIFLKANIVMNQELLIPNFIYVGTLDGDHMWEWSPCICAFSHYSTHKLGARGKLELNLQNSNPVVL